MPTILLPNADPTVYHARARAAEDRELFRNSKLYRLENTPGVWRSLKGPCSIGQINPDVENRKALVPDGTDRSLWWMRQVLVDPVDNRLTKWMQGHPELMEEGSTIDNVLRLLDEHVKHLRPPTQEPGRHSEGLPKPF